MGFPRITSGSSAVQQSNPQPPAHQLFQQQLNTHLPIPITLEPTHPNEHHTFLTTNLLFKQPSKCLEACTTTLAPPPAISALPAPAVMTRVPTLFRPECIWGVIRGPGRMSVCSGAWSSSKASAHWEKGRDGPKGMHKGLQSVTRENWDG